MNVVLETSMLGLIADSFDKRIHKKTQVSGWFGSGVEHYWSETVHMKSPLCNRCRGFSYGVMPEQGGGIDDGH
jgi:hypothetical protein